MLKDAIGGIRDEAVALSEQGIWIALTGLIILLTDKVMKSSVANWALVAQFSDWLFNRGLRSGLPVSHVVFSAIFMILIIIAAVLRYSLLGWFSILSDFPTDPDYGLNSITWVEVLFAFCVANREMVFDLITYGIRMILDPSCFGVGVCKDPLDRNRQPYRAADTADGGYSHRDLVGQCSGLHGVVGVLGKGHDHVGAVGNSDLPVRPYWYSSG